jgi:transcriptional regulator GlxA family with amidase domain
MRRGASTLKDRLGLDPKFHKIDIRHKEGILASFRRTGMQGNERVRVLILGLPETAGSALYGMIDVLMAAGNLWQTLSGEPVTRSGFDVHVISPTRERFYCGNGIPIEPSFCLADDPEAELLILPEIWLGPQEHISGRYNELMQWLKRRFSAGLSIYSACSGSILLAESGLLNNCEATSHWGYQDLFRECYPSVRFRPESNLVVAHPGGRLITAGGTTSWHDLALHIIARFMGSAEALRIAKVYLLKWHAEGQLPFSTLARRLPHADSVVRGCENWLRENFRDPRALMKVTQRTGIPERTLKRRFKQATGSSPIEYLQNLRIEEAKRLLEQGDLPVEEICVAAGYECVSFFRRLFKRLTGVNPAHYRRMFLDII